MKPILFISDTHYHNFHQYAQINPSGLNSRLADIMRATIEAAKALRAAGGNLIVHCGDVFHVRGNISPTVLNPVMDMYRKLREQGFEIVMLSGNHDLETNDADHTASTVTALKSVGVEVINEPTIKWWGDVEMVLVPWYSKLDDVRHIIKSPPKRTSGVSKRRIIALHAPLNGVIEGLPDHGLTPADFTGWGWDLAAIGHYHNHRVFDTPGSTTHKIMSVGSLTHQNWGDVDSRAGFVIYDPETGQITQHATSAPKFIKVDITELDEADVQDSYVKVVGGEFDDPADIETIRNNLILEGAKAVVVEGMVRRPAVTRAGGSTTTTPTLQTVLTDYIDRNYPGEDGVKLAALEILGEVYD